MYNDTGPIGRRFHLFISRFGRNLSSIIKYFIYIFTFFKVMLLKFAIFSAICAILLATTNVTSYLVILAVFTVYQVSGGWRVTKLIYYTFLRDVGLVNIYNIFLF